MDVRALAVAAALLVAACHDDPDPTPPTPPTDPAADLLGAFERSRLATFAADQMFTRTPPGGGPGLEYDRRLVQRPPDDRLLVGGGAAEGRLDGRIVRCSTLPDGTSRCDEGGDAPDDEVAVAAEVDALRSLVSGDARAYDVAAGEAGCFTLTLRLDVPSPPYGTAATFCYDDATGAPTRIEVVREQATDLVVTTEIRPDVTAADLVPGDLGPLPAAG